jgi:hypothetical protein
MLEIVKQAAGAKGDKAAACYFPDQVQLLIVFQAETAATVF